MLSTPPHENLISVKHEYEVTEKNELSLKTKKKKKYSMISQQVREKFINKVLSKVCTIKEAAKEFGLKLSTSKAILQTYKKEGRIGKKKNRVRKTQVIKVALSTINSKESGLTPSFKINFKNLSADLRRENPNFELDLLKNMIAEKHTNVNRTLANAQNNNTYSLKPHQHTMLTEFNKNRMINTSLLNSNFCTGAPRSISGLCNGIPSNVDLQYKTLLDSVLQRSNSGLIFMNQLNQQNLNAQNNLYQSYQTNFLQNSNVLSQNLIEMNAARTENIYSCSNYGILPTNLQQNAISLSRSIRLNPFNLQIYQFPGTFPTKRVCLTNTPLGNPTIF